MLLERSIRSYRIYKLKRYIYRELIEKKINKRYSDFFYKNNNFIKIFEHNKYNFINKKKKFNNKFSNKNNKIKKNKKKKKKKKKEIKLIKKTLIKIKKKYI